MPRRMINSSIWLNERFGSLPDPARLLFIGLFSNADDDGRLRASPAYLKALIFPYDDKSPDNVMEWRNLCQDKGLILVYNINGGEYLQLLGWHEHQNIRKDTYHASKIPAPNDMFNNDTTSLQPRNEAVTPRNETETQYSIDKYSIVKNSKDGNKLPSSSEKGQKVKEVFSQLDKLRGYRPPKRKAEAASIIRMLKTYTPKQIINTWETLKTDKFWQKQELYMMSVESQIGAILSGTHKSSVGKVPTRYTRPEELLQ